MKRLTIITALILIIFSAYTLKPTEAQAGDISVGAMTWFSWWNPVWSKTSVLHSDTNLNFELPPGFITGPVVTYKFDDQWSMSAVFLYWKYNTEDTAFVGNSFFRTERDVHKIEADIIVNYRVSNLVKWFFGIKYQGYFYDEAESYIAPPVELIFERTVSFHNLGPGMGIGLTIPLFGGLYFLPNISAIILTGYNRIDRDTQFAFSLGGNMSASLAYYIQSLGTTIVAGFRYQQLFYLYHGYQGYQDDDDQIYGVTFSVIVAL